MKQKVLNYYLFFVCQCQIDSFEGNLQINYFYSLTVLKFTSSYYLYKNELRLYFKLFSSHLFSIEQQLN